MMRASLTALAGMIVVGSSAMALQAQDLRAVRFQGDVVLWTSGTLSDAVIANAPFSADALTTVTQTLADGTKIEQRTTTKWYRDSTGRIRREQTVIGLDRLNPSASPQTTITFDSVPGDPQPYTLNPSMKTARRGPRGLQWFTYFTRSAATGTRTRALQLATPGGTLAIFSQPGMQVAPVPPDAQAKEGQLAARQVEGVKATGRRKTTTIPAGRIGNDRPIQIVEEQWESPELNMVISSRFSDPRTGVVEYRLTNISRAEPRADLFAVPADYTVVDPGQPGQRGGRRGN